MVTLVNRRFLCLCLLTAVVIAVAVVGPTNAGAADPARLNRITFDDIKFKMKKGAPFKRSMLTKKIENLNGKSIRLRGYILPSFQQSGIKRFVLVRDNMECCFGPGAALFDCVLVEMADGKSTSFTVRPVSVEGRFQIHEFKGPDGKHLAIYRMQGLKVQ